MGRLGLEGCDILHDIQRLQRKRAHCWNKESEFDNSDTWRFKRQLRKTNNIDEDYAQYLMLLFDYNKESTNEGGNEGPAIVKDKLNHDVDVYEDDDDDEDGDEDDPDYKKFLTNAKPNGNSYVVKIDRSNGFPVHIEFEKEEGSDEEYERLGRGKQQDAGDEEDLDKVESQAFSRTDLENDNDVIVEPSGLVTQKEKGRTSQNHKRRQKDETVKRSNKEQKTGKGRKSAKKITNKEEAADVDEDYALLLEKFIYKNWQNSFIRKYNLKRQQSSRSVLENDSDSDPLPPKKKKKEGLTSKKNNTKGNDASKKQGKGEKKKRSSKEQTARKGRKASAIVAVNEDVAGREPLNVAVKEEIADVDEASFKAAEDLQLIASENCTFGNEGSSSLIEASSAILCENVEDSFPLQTVHSDFWWKVKALLERPYDQKEYMGLWKLVKSRKPTLKNMDLRNGKFCSTRQLGKSYLDHYKDLHEKLKEVDGDNNKKLNILRGFFFWLQNLTQQGAFRPWTNPEWLSLLDNSSVPALTFHD